jgi:3-hydroxyisobutyrate dehydrogenase-like beta-hydroxyacid dehydrogenase
VRTFVDLSTTGPRASREAAAGLAAAQVDFVDAPVSGGRASIARGSLAIMVSAGLPALERARPYLEQLGKVFHVGEEAGLAQTMKLVNNMMSVAALVITSEAMVLGTKAGLDPAIMIDVLNASTGRNSATADKFPRAVLPGTFDFGFPIGLSLKDIGLCLGEAEQMNVPMPLGSITRQVMSIAQAMYGADADFTSVCKVFETWGATEVRKRAESGAAAVA